MSARDRLDNYERDWQHHQRWRAPSQTLISGTLLPGRYVDAGSGFGRHGHSFNFHEMPSELRDRVAKRLEPAMAKLVDEEHAALVEELRAAALAEAKATLAELETTSSESAK